MGSEINDRGHTHTEQLCNCIPDCSSFCPLGELSCPNAIATPCGSTTCGHQQGAPHHMAQQQQQCTIDYCMQKVLEEGMCKEEFLAFDQCFEASQAKGTDEADCIPLVSVPLLWGR